MLKLYENIKTRRLELGMTQSELADKVGYADKSMIAKIEAGKVNLRQSRIMAFAAALNTTASDLMGWEIEDTALALFARLGTVDQERIIERMETMLEADKYIKKGDTSKKMA